MGVGCELPPAVCTEQDAVGRTKNLIFAEGAARRVNELDADFRSGAKPAGRRLSKTLSAIADLTRRTPQARAVSRHPLAPWS
ncbi:MAG TPA: hypothetical protein VGH32_09590 [Pirellulales bacterium]